MIEVCCGTVRDAGFSSLAAGPSGVLSGVLSRPPVLIIVPDQATFQMEKAILEDGRISGFLNLQVLGFRRRASRYWMKQAKSPNLLSPCQQEHGCSIHIVGAQEQLSVYAPMVNSGSGRVIQALSEFNAYDVSPGDLEIVQQEEGKYLFSRKNSGTRAHTVSTLNSSKTTSLT